MTLCYPVIDTSFSRAGLREHLACIPNNMIHSQFELLEKVTRKFIGVSIHNSIEVVYQIDRRVVTGLIIKIGALPNCNQYSREEGKTGRELNCFVGVCYEYSDNKGFLFPDKRQLSNILIDFFRDKWDKLKRDNIEHFFSNPSEMELHPNTRDRPYRRFLKSNAIKIKPSCSNIFLKDMISESDGSASHIYLNNVPKQSTVTDMGVYFSTNFLNFNHMIKK